MAFAPLQFNKANLQRLLTALGTYVTSWSGGSTGLTPATATTGDVVLGGTLNVANGGTGSTTSTGTAASGVVLRTSPNITDSLTVTGAANTTALAVSGLFNSTATAVNFLDYNVTATAVHASSLVERIRGGAAATTVLRQLDPSGNMELLGYAAIGRASSLTQGGSATLAAYLGATASGLLGVFGGIGSPTFNPLGRAGGIYLNATTTAGAPGIPSYNVDGTATGWQTLVGREATQTLTNKTLTSPTISSPTISGTVNGIGSQSATTFLGGDVPVPTANTYANGPNTGSIGASGQTWLIIAGGDVLTGGSGAQVALRIFNGSAGIKDCNASLAATTWASMEMSVIVVLSAATTFTLQVTDNAGGNNTNLKTTGTNGTANKATSISAVRLA